MTITEDELELLAIEWFKNLGYDYLLGYDIAPNGETPLRKNYEDVLLENRLETALIKLNPSIPFDAITDVIYRLKRPQKTSLVQNNQEFHKMLLQGVSIEVKKDDGADIEIVKLIDFHNIENNDFLVVNQYTINGKTERRPDIIVFINGLPISVIELKNPVGENATIEEAFNQIQTYKNEIEDLFVYNEAIVISDGINARIASLTADREWYMYWRTIENENDKPKLELELETMINGFFKKELLLDYLQNFVLFEDNGKDLIKKNAGYHQFHGVREAVSSVLRAKFNKTRKAGIEREDKDTRVVFGDYISIYDIEDAVNDKATVPIYYESRLAKLDIDEALMKDIDNEVEELVEGSELSDQESFKSKWSTLEKLVGAKNRVEEIAKDLVEHFENRLSSISGKGMIVAMSRAIAVELYDAIIQLKPRWHNEDPQKGVLKIIMTGSASDNQEMQKHIYSKQVKKEIEKRFKDNEDELKLVIVIDMWLTGFDAPSLHTMYIDKPMKSHNLMQAIARVNRVFKDKEGGLVVDYIGIGNELKNALKTYTNSKGKGKTTIDTQEAYNQLIERIEIIRNMYHGFDYSNFKENSLILLPSSANHILGLKDGKKRYFDTVLAMSKALSLCSGMDEIKEFKEEIAFFQAVKIAILKSFENPRKKVNKNIVIKQIIDNAIVSDGVDDIFKLIGIEKPNISILSEQFINDISNIPYKNLAVELLEKLLKDTIKARTKTNIVKEKKFSDRLKASLNNYHVKGIETAQIIEELIAMAREIAKDFENEKKLGLDFDELAFYDALSENEEALREMGDKILKNIAIELTEKLRKSISVDWQKRESVRAKMRNIIRIILKRYKYPPNKSSEAISLVMKQTEVLSNEWSK